MGLIYYVDANTGDIVSIGSCSITGAYYGNAFDTNVGTARLYMSGTSLVATGTDANIDIDITAKGVGSVNLNRVDINEGTIDNTIIGGATPAAGYFTSLEALTGSFGTATSTNFAFYDADSSNVLNVSWGEDDVADRLFTINVNGGDRALNVYGNATVDQDVTVASTPEFAGLTLTGFNGFLSAAAGVVTAASLTLDGIPDGALYGKVLLTSLNAGEVVYLTDATGDNMSVNCHGADRVLHLYADVSLDQSLRTVDTPTFAGINTATLSLSGVTPVDTLLTLTARTSLTTPVFTGTGNDDLSLGASFYTGSVDRSYVVEVDVAGGDPANPNTFRWSNDGGGTWIASNVPMTRVNTPSFAGTGNNDISTGASVYTGASDKTYTIEIEVGGGDPVNPNTFRWNDGGAWTTGVAITGAPQLLSDGVSITFAATTGHNDGDAWTILAEATPTILLENGISITFGAPTGHDGGDDWAFDATAFAGNYLNALSAAGGSLARIDASGNFYNSGDIISGGDLTITNINASGDIDGANGTLDSLVVDTTIDAASLDLEADATNIDVLDIKSYTSLSLPVYTDGGGGLNDMSHGINSLYSGGVTTYYEVEIDSIGATDTFKWSNNAGFSWVATGIPIPGAGVEYELENGVTVVFAAVTGHASGDNWAFTATAFSGNHEVYRTPDGEIGAFKVLQRMDTIDATPRIMASFPVAVNKSLLLRVKVSCIEDAAPATEWAAYDLEGQFYRVTAGNVTQQGVTSVIFEDETTAGMNCDFVVNVAFQRIDVVVTGVAATNLKWKCFAEAVLT